MKHKKINTTCDCCGENRFKIYSICIPMLFVDGDMRLFCIECGISYISQFLGMRDYEMEDYLDFTLK